MKHAIYVVTDIETDGPRTGENSMLSFASVAVASDGTRFGEFEAVLAPLDELQADPETVAWLKTQPGVWEAATNAARPARTVMDEFVAWVRSLPGEPIFAAHPLAFDGLWINWYLQRFTTEQLMEGPWKPNRLFRDAGLCILSFASGRLGRPLWECRYPAEWLGNVEHTHCAIDDARGYANLLIKLLGMTTPET